MDPTLEIIVDDQKLASANRKRRSNSGSSTFHNQVYKRRLSKDGLIEIYDLGYRKVSGIWHTIPDFLINPPWILDPAVATLTATKRALSVAEYNPVRDFILGVGVSSFKSQFKKISKATNSEQYDVGAIIDGTFALLDDFEEWENEGLNVTQEQLDAGIRIFNGAKLEVFANASILQQSKRWFISDIFTYPLILKETANQKITTTPNYADAPVSFTPVPKMIVYMMPGYATSGGQGSVQRSTSNDVSWLRSGYMIQPREWALDSSNPNYEKRFGANILYPYAQDPSWYAEILDIISRHLVIPSSEGKTWNNATLAFVDGFTYQPTATPSYPQQVNLSIGWGSAEYSYGGPPNGILTAIIEKESTFYYIWTHGYV